MPGMNDQHREITRQNGDTQGLLNRWRWGLPDGQLNGSMVAEQNAMDLECHRT